MLSPLRQRSMALPRLRRALATAVEQSPSTSASSVPPKRGSLASPRYPARRSGKQSLYIRPWDGVTSMPEAFAILRSLEHKYGKFKYYQFLRVRITRFLSPLTLKLGDRIRTFLTCISPTSSPN